MLPTQTVLPAVKSNTHNSPDSISVSKDIGDEPKGTTVHIRDLNFHVEFENKPKRLKVLARVFPAGTIVSSHLNVIVSPVIGEETDEACCN